MDFRGTALVQIQPSSKPTAAANHTIAFFHSTETYHRVSLPPEYEFDISLAEFKRDIPRWTKTKSYTEGAIDLTTTLTLHTDITQPSGERKTSVVVLVQVPKRSAGCSYRTCARVTLHDPNTGLFLNEKEEEREFKDGLDTVKFEVSIGPHENIERCSNHGKLRLQAKVKVHEYCTDWVNLVYSKPSSHPPVPHTQ